MKMCLKFVEFFLVPVVLGLVVFGCSDDSSDDEGLAVQCKASSLSIINRSQFPLDHVILTTPEDDDYRKHIGALTGQITLPFPVDGVAHNIVLQEGASYKLTVAHVKNGTENRLYAYTMPYGFSVKPCIRYTITVFDESFRIQQEEEPRTYGIPSSSEGASSSEGDSSSEGVSSSSAS